MLFKMDQTLRNASKLDVTELYNLTKNSVIKETLLERSLISIEESIDNYIVYEINRQIVGCTCLYYFNESDSIEIGSVFVKPNFTNKGIGKKLIDRACKQAFSKGYINAFILTNSAKNYFIKKCGFELSSLSELPKVRQKEYIINNRPSYILKKTLI